MRERRRERGRPSGKVIRPDLISQILALYASM